MGKQIHKSVLVNWMGLAIRIATAILLLPYIVETIGVDRYGEYYFLALIFGYSELLEFGLRAAILRYTGALSGRGDFSALNRILGTVFSYYAVAALAVLAAGAVLFWSTPEWILPVGASEKFALYAGIFAVVAASTFFRIGWSSVLRATERYDLLNLVEIGGFLLRAAVIVVLLMRGWGVLAVLMGDLLDSLFVALASRVAIRRVDPRIGLAFHGLEKDELREVLGYSGWAFLSSLAFQLRFRGPGIVVGGVLSTGAGGYFGVASRLQSYVFQLGTAMNSPFRARATTLAGSGELDPVRETLYNGTRFLCFLACTLCGMLFVYADELLVTWMNGDEFLISAVVLRILLVGLVFELSALMLGGALYATGHLRVYAVTNLVEAAVILGLSYGLAHTHELVGVAAGVSLPIILNKAIVQPILLLRILGVSLSRLVTRSLLRPALTIVIGVGPMWLLRTVWSPQSLTVVVGHFAVAGLIQIALGWFLVLTGEEKDRVRQMLRRN